MTDRELESALERILAGTPSTTDEPREVQRLREAVAPLALDREAGEPPAHLMATLERRLEVLRRPHIAEPLTSPRRAGRWWRGDALVAASLLVVTCALLLGGVSQLRARHAIVACQNNLRELHASLVTYAGDHGGTFPHIGAGGQASVAGELLPRLQRDGVVPTRVACANTGAGYAYHLGYRAVGQLCAVRLDLPGNGSPLAADRPPFDRDSGSAPDHGRGFNVLYVGGQVRFCTSPRVGVEGDHIFLNDAQQVAAGLRPADAVLGTGSDRP